MSSQKVNDYMNREVKIDEWAADVKRYLKDVKGNLLTEKKMIFLIKSQTFRTITQPRRCVSVMVCFQFVCEILFSFLWNQL